MRVETDGFPTLKGTHIIEDADRNSILGFLQGVNDCMSVTGGTTIKSFRPITGGSSILF